MFWSEAYIKTIWIKMRSFEVLWTKFWTLKGLSCKDLVCKDIYANKYAGIKNPNRIFSFKVSIQNKNRNVEINLSDWGYISHEKMNCANYLTTWKTLYRVSDSKVNRVILLWWGYCTKEQRHHQNQFLFTLQWDTLYVASFTTIEGTPTPNLTECQIQWLVPC